MTPSDDVSPTPRTQPRDGNSGPFFVPIHQLLQVTREDQTDPAEDANHLRGTLPKCQGPERPLGTEGQYGEITATQS